MNTLSELKLDEHGHLLNHQDWNEDIGRQLADQDNIALSESHWQIIHLVRNIYLQTETTPPMRLLIKAIKKHLGEEQANSRHLYRLFADGPVRLASKYAGLPRPKHCM